MTSLNEPYSTLATRRRYEVWFLRMNLADGSGAWWFRYLLMNPGRSGCPDHPLGKPVQVWATWFPKDGEPRSFIQGFSLAHLRLTAKNQNPFEFEIADNSIGEDSCRGHLSVNGHDVSWSLQYRSTFQFTMSSKGWIGFSRTPHADATFTGHIILDGRRFAGEPLAFGLQGHNCGYRHRSFWTWAHASFPSSKKNSTIFEALLYEMPLGLVFRRAVLWHEARQYVFRNLQDVATDRDSPRWSFRCFSREGARLDVLIDGSGSGTHRLPYLKTDCSGTFEVVNNSRSRAQLHFEPVGGPAQDLETSDGAVLEIAGRR